ncbi:hypothetical protein CIB84_008524, partial [Bambusicola thoracicus]
VPKRYQEYITAANKQRLSASLLQLMRNGYSKATCLALSPPLTSTLEGYTAIFTVHIQPNSSEEMIALIFFSALLWDEAQAWGFKDGVLHNSIWLERAAGVYHRESRSGKYQLTYAEAKAVCEYEGGHLATYQQLEAARKIGFHVCAAGWMAKGRVGYPIVKAGANCGFGRTGIVDYGIRLNRSERWDAYCYNPNGVFGNNSLLFMSKAVSAVGQCEGSE